MNRIVASFDRRAPWNKGKLVGRKATLKLKDILSIRVRLQLSERRRDLALFHLALDSKLRACDLVKLRVRDIVDGGHIASRPGIAHRKVRRPVQFEMTEQTKEALMNWIQFANRKADDFLFPSRNSDSPHLSTRQYARVVRSWIRQIGLDASAYGTHTLRRTDAALIFRRTKTLRAAQLFLGHTKLENTARYLGFRIDDEHEMADQMEV